MSTMEIYRVESSGDVVLAGEASNSFGGAMHIWKTLHQAHISKRQLDDLELGRLLMSFSGFEQLWTSIRELPARDRWVLGSTFDDVVIPVEHLATYLGHLKAFAQEHPSETLGEAIAVLEPLVGSEIMGVAFNHTSVNHSPWTVYDDDEDDEGRPYNVNRDTDHFLLTPRYLGLRAKRRATGGATP